MRLVAAGWEVGRRAVGNSLVSVGSSPSHPIKSKRKKGKKEKGSPAGPPPGNPCTEFLDASLHLLQMNGSLASNVYSKAAAPTPTPTR